MTVREVVVDSLDHHDDEDAETAADDPWRLAPPVGTPDVGEVPI